MSNSARGGVHSTIDIKGRTFLQEIRAWSKRKGVWKRNYQQLSYERLEISICLRGNQMSYKSVYTELVQFLSYYVCIHKRFINDYLYTRKASATWNFSTFPSLLNFPVLLQVFVNNDIHLLPLRKIQWLVLFVLLGVMCLLMKFNYCQADKAWQSLLSTYFIWKMLE